MDDLIGPGILVLLIGLLGWVLGIVGFVRANRAMAEIRWLEAALIPWPARRPLETSAPMPAPEPARPTPLPRLIPPPPPPLPEPPPEPLPPRRNWKALLTAQWGVWLGAVALLFAGVFLVRYASDHGLLGPALALVAMTGAKIVLFDMAGLTELWRVLSLPGLGPDAHWAARGLSPFCRGDARCAVIVTGSNHFNVLYYRECDR